ncbi:gluconeogenesis factor YvcK family protein [Williamsia phyllosphaerae]|uniref:Putative gluconeogenesis factor n=1 Tax=Williamsia phyllosphaerae TaxID=885042 RepID=A0ABQ1V6Y6_9NOCA|nr:uridine diphosphate-N-acetylglucosamine-binding protein YvcK [Williamsia phyllosphaerae]GGF41734.1 putative gluconeogenesis factor [Williamsia phyllosphaerae]
MSRGVGKIVALGGGHGLHATLTAMRRLSDEVTAVVTVADDGGSSGRLRSELGVIPPGDLRMAIAALMSAGGEHEPAGGRDRWVTLLQHRFGGRGALAGHPVGNLLLAGLTEELGDPVAALDAVMELFGVPGRVLPMSAVPLNIEAEVSGLEADPRISRSIAGQVAVATTPGTVRRVRLLPPDPPACPEALDAIAAADLVVLGPGSWFSSVIPHVLVPEQLAALKSTAARRMLFVNLAPEPGETSGFSVERHLHVLHAHADDFRIDDVIVDAGSAPAGRERDHVERAAGLFGARLHVGDLAQPGTHVHDPEKLASMVLTLCEEQGDGYAVGAVDRPPSADRLG